MVTFSGNRVGSSWRLIRCNLFNFNVNDFGMRLAVEPITQWRTGTGLGSLSTIRHYVHSVLVSVARLWIEVTVAISIWTWWAWWNVLVVWPGEFNWKNISHEFFRLFTFGTVKNHSLDKWYFDLPLCRRVILWPIECLIILWSTLWIALETLVILWLVAWIPLGLSISFLAYNSFCLVTRHFHR